MAGSFLSTVEIDTPRLKIREFSFEDHDCLVDMIAHEDIALIMSRLDLSNPSKYVDSWLNTSNAQRKNRFRISYALGIDHPDMGLIGGCNLTKGSTYFDYSQASLGFFLSPEARGQGYMSESLGSFLSYSFDEFDIRRVYAHVICGNDDSSKVLEGIGFTKGGVERAAFETPYGDFRDVIQFDLLKGELGSD